MAGRIAGFAVIGEDHVLAIVLQPIVAVRALTATIHEAAYAHLISDVEASDGPPYGGHTADDFMAGHAGVLNARPLRADLMDVGVADAAVGDIDLHVVRAGCAPEYCHGLKGLIAGVGAIGMDGHCFRS